MQTPLTTPQQKKKPERDEGFALDFSRVGLPWIWSHDSIRALGTEQKTKLLISKMSLSTQMVLLLEKKKKEDSQGISAASESKN